VDPDGFPMAWIEIWAAHTVAPTYNASLGCSSPKSLMGSPYGPMANGKKKHMRFFKKGKFVLKLFFFRSKKQSFGG
jgi:hypothetical protein